MSAVRHRHVLRAFDRPGFLEDPIEALLASAECQAAPNLAPGSNRANTAHVARAFTILRDIR